LVSALDEVSLPAEFSADLSLVYRKLEKLGDSHALPTIPRVLVRSPDLSATAMKYAASLAIKNPESVVAVFADVLSKERFSREYEKLNICHKALSLKPDPNSDLGARLGHLAKEDAHPLIRAKALVAWGLHSDPTDFDVFDQFLLEAEPQWRAYALVSIQHKEREARDARFAAWAGKGEGIARVATVLREAPIRWSRL
jgi:hypothetical protein